MRRSISVLIVLLLTLLVTGAALAQAEPDRDGDGVGDSKDRCPSEAGPAALDGCPDGDSDGVANIDDACPAVPGSIENRGCPLDSDGDGTPDTVDHCPTEGGHADNGGCPASPDATSVPTAAPQSGLNPLQLPLSGPCVAAPALDVRVNGRSAPGQDAAIIAVLEPDVFYPVLGILLPPDNGTDFLVIELEDVLISSAQPTQPAVPFEGFQGGVFVAANTMKVGGDCQNPAILIGLLLPAVQKVREAAARIQSQNNTAADFHRLFGDSNGDGTSYLTIKLSDVLVSSLQNAQEEGDEAAGGSTGQGTGKVVFQDIHFATQTPGFLRAQIVEGEDGDELVFDLVDVPDPAAATDFLLDLGDVKGESKDGVHPTTGAILWLLKQLTKLDGSSEPTGPDGSCEQQVFDQLAALGATAGAVPTPYGIEFMVRLPEGTQPPADPCADTVPTDQFSLNWYGLDWMPGEDGGSQASLLKVGPGTLAFAGGVGIGFDGSLCVDLQPEGAEALCLPAVQ